MPRKRKQKKVRAFTLIELTLVVAILGILAAMSLPLFAAVDADTKRSATEATVVETQKAIDLYRLKLGELPDLTKGWAPLTKPVDRDGQRFGPFLNTIPRNALLLQNYSTLVDASSEVFQDQAAFGYDYASGEGTGRISAALRARP